MFLLFSDGYNSYQLHLTLNDMDMITSISCWILIYIIDSGGQDEIV